MKIFGVLLIGIASLPGAVLAQGASCKVIQDNAARLACFDKGVSDAKPQAVRAPKADVAKAQPLTPAFAAGITPDQGRDKLARAFLDAGIKPGKPAFAAGITPDQGTYRDKLDRVFLDAGIKMSVEAISNPKGATVPPGAKLPVLLIWNSYLDRPSVYQIQQKLDVIGDARKANFGTVVFYGAQGTGNMYSFDVSKPGQTCSRDLCF